MADTRRDRVPEGVKIGPVAHYLLLENVGSGRYREISVELK